MTVQTSLDRLRNTLSPRLAALLQRSRVCNEAADILGQTFAGMILKSLARALLDTLMIWCSLLLLAYVMNRLLPERECVACCFVRNADVLIDNAASCCAGHPFFVLRLLAFAMAAAAGSFFSTRMTVSRKFQHSSMVAVGVMFGLSAFLSYTAFPAWLVPVLYIFIFFAMFTGYRLALRKGRGACSTTC
jgi:hypothetical protein